MSPAPGSKHQDQEHKRRDDWPTPACPLPAQWSWASAFFFLCLSFLICNMGVQCLPPAWLVVMDSKWAKQLKHSMSCVQKPFGKCWRLFLTILLLEPYFPCAPFSLQTSELFYFLGNIKDLGKLLSCPFRTRWNLKAYAPVEHTLWRFIPPEKNNPWELPTQGIKSIFHL